MQQVEQNHDRQRVASYPDYEQAQAAVDSLSDADFPVEHLSIVAEDLQVVEDITGRRGYGGAAWQGFLSGALVGATLGVLFGLLRLVRPVESAFVLAFYGLIFGGILGALSSMAGHWSTKGRRDFSSTSRLQAGRYDVVADAHVAPNAARLLESGASTSLAGRRSA